MALNKTQLNDYIYGSGRNGNSGKGSWFCCYGGGCYNFQRNCEIFSCISFEAWPERTNRYLASVNAVAQDHVHEKKVTPPEKAGEWLLLVHIMIGNMKTFLNGTFHGVSSNYLQEYVDEFCYRFNRRFWEPELSLRLLNACLAHVPVKIAEFH